MTKDDALKLALETFVKIDKRSGYPNHKKEIKAIKEALEQQEPAANGFPSERVHASDTSKDHVAKAKESQHEKGSAANKPWVGLTDEERKAIEDACETIIGEPAFESIEAKLREKNA